MVRVHFDFLRNENPWSDSSPAPAPAAAAAPSCFLRLNIRLNMLGGLPDRAFPAAPAKDHLCQITSGWGLKV